MPEGFPNIILNEYFTELTENKSLKSNYSSLYSQHTKNFDSQHSEDLNANKYKIPEPSKDCQKLRDKLMKKHSDIFKEKLSQDDRINALPIRLQAGLSWGSVQAETVSLEPCLAHSYKLLIYKLALK